MSLLKGETQSKRDKRIVKRLLICLSLRRPQDIVGDGKDCPQMRQIDSKMAIYLPHLKDEIKRKRDKKIA